MTVRWSVILPFYNEAEFLALTLRSLAEQTLWPAQLVLVDNGSTDGSAEICRQIIAAHGGMDAVILEEPQPGKIPALAKGLALVETPFVATCDADTFYPPRYLERCDQLFTEGGDNCVAVMACDIHGQPHAAASRWRRAKIAAKARLFTSKCHAGGYAQAFHTDALRKAGGFDLALWPFVLEDHEVVNRLLRLGEIRYAADHWCIPSTRRSDRTGVSWTRMERLLYACSPAPAKDWFFYDFLAPRFEKRRLDFLKLRERDWEGEHLFPGATR
jgi:glycosyltransferase involved in cell wall biosynthesis